MVDRAALEALARVEDDGWPSILCPSCSAGHLTFDRASTVEAARSARLHDHEGFDPDWISGTFTTHAVCSNRRCQEAVLFAGDYAVESGGSAGQQYVGAFVVRYVNPPLPIMDFSPGTPDEVIEGVRRAAALVHLDPPAAANALRAAVERFLTVQGIADRDGNRFLGAHERIGGWRKQTGNSDVANCFWAVKWIGNDGSHEISALTVAQVLAGVEILEYAFRLLFDQTGKRIEAAAAAINAAKGLPTTPAL